MRLWLSRPNQGWQGRVDRPGTQSNTDTNARQSSELRALVGAVGMGWDGEWEEGSQDVSVDLDVGKDRLRRGGEERRGEEEMRGSESGYEFEGRVKTPASQPASQRNSKYGPVNFRREAHVTIPPFF